MHGVAYLYILRKARGENIMNGIYTGMIYLDGC